MNDVDEGTHCVIVPERVDKSSNKQPGLSKNECLGGGYWKGALIRGGLISNFSVFLKVHVKKIQCSQPTKV